MRKSLRDAVRNRRILDVYPLDGEMLLMIQELVFWFLAGFSQQLLFRGKERLGIARIPLGDVVRNRRKEPADSGRVPA